MSPSSQIQKYYEPQKTMIEFSQWMLDALEREAKRLGVTLQAIAAR